MHNVDVPAATCTDPCQVHNSASLLNNGEDKFQFTVQCLL